MRTLRSKTVAVSATKEDYVRAIYLLQNSPKGATVTDIALRLGLRKSTVSERIKELVKDGLVTADPYADISLTKEGVFLGEKMTYKHRIIEVFLNDVLKVPKNKIHEEAERLEHAVSDDVIKRLAKFLEHPTSDPHGSDIPKIKKWN
ncbi:MAG: Iron-dependent repressor IdeR [Parcubacteria bacterium OLB19]|nr:MAG: Iron-dependent repressor IdeR [Parcubacteria bacterium OLB19]